MDLSDFAKVPQKNDTLYKVASLDAPFTRVFDSPSQVSVQSQTSMLDFVYF